MSVTIESSTDPATPEQATPVPKKMRAVTARTYGTTEVISLEEIPVPTPKKGELLVKVEASSLNALDWHFLTGTPYFLRLMVGLRKPKRITPGADVAGTVVTVGPEVTEFQAGDAVFGEVQGGGCGDYLIAKAASVAAIPDGVTFRDAGATPVAGLTAVQALRTHADLQSGEHVLINGAAGGVGTCAVQIAKAMGAEVTAVCSTGNVDMVKALGADEVIDYTKDDFTSRGPRFHVMMDNVGNRSAAECLNVLHHAGRYVMISGPKDNRLLGPVPKVVGTALKFKRASQSFHQFTASPNQEDMRFLGELLAGGKLKPEIQRVIDLDGVAEGLREIGTGHARAKIVVVPALA